MGNNWLFFLFIVVLFLIILFGVVSIFYDIIKFAYFKIVDVAAEIKPLSAKRKVILQTYFFYYNRLSHTDQKKFEVRVNQFLHRKQFIGRGIAITEEMKVLSSATAILLSFGLPMVYLTHFDKILIYPNEYYSKINQNYQFWRSES